MYPDEEQNTIATPRDGTKVLFGEPLLDEEKTGTTQPMPRWGRVAQALRPGRGTGRHVGPRQTIAVLRNTATATIFATAGVVTTYAVLTSVNPAAPASEPTIAEQISLTPTKPKAKPKPSRSANLILAPMGALPTKPAPRPTLTGSPDPTPRPTATSESPQPSPTSSPSPTSAGPTGSPEPALSQSESMPEPTRTTSTQSPAPSLTDWLLCLRVGRIGAAADPEIEPCPGRCRR